MPKAIKAAPKKYFLFLTAAEFDRKARPHTLGITNKKTGEITLRDISSNDAQFAAMGAALHEMVHLVSYPPELGKDNNMFTTVGEGIYEGLTQVVSVDILQDQGLGTWSSADYGNREAIVRKIIEVLAPNGVEIFGKALFLGKFEALSPIAQKLGGANWEKIKGFATNNDSAAAIKLIERK